MSKQQLFDDLNQVLGKLADASQRMRGRLDQIDPYEQPARWGALNDQIRALDERISGLRDQQQRLVLGRTELPELRVAELERLRAATSTLAELVRTAGTAAAVAEAAVKLAASAQDLIERTLPKS